MSTKKEIFYFNRISLKKILINKKILVTSKKNSLYSKISNEIEKKFENMFI